MNVTRRLGIGLWLLLILLLLAGCGNQSTAIELEGALLTQLSSGLVVNSLADPGDGICDATECTLREAIDAATSGATITFDVTGTIVLQAQLGIDEDLTIAGPGAASLAVSGDGRVRVIDIAAGTAVRISGLTITDGSAQVGAGIRSFSGDLVLSHVVVRRNYATDPADSSMATRGGGIATFGALTLENSHVTSNVASNTALVYVGAEGGGLYSEGVLTITDSAITGNYVSQRFVGMGGGITVSGPTTITNSTVSGNYSGSRSGQGGGIWRRTDAALILVNSTVAKNSANYGGGIAVLGSTNPVTLINTLVAGNEAGVRDPDLSGVNNVVAVHSLIGDPTGHTVTDGVDGNIVGVSAADLHLGALTDNGGPTPTRALLPGSPALDAGTTTGCPATDQRGVLRPQGAGCDIGAYEHYENERMFEGFFSPVNDEPTLNSAKAVQTIPLKWHLQDVFGNPITDLSSATVSVTSLACTAGATTDAIEEYARGTSGLQNLGDGHYQFNWATPKNYAGTCKTMRLDLGDGITQTALFQFTK
jgi:CSLREA domain-containing protein